MPHFGAASLRRLGTCHPDIQRVMNQAIKNGPDFAILCGFRDEAEQNAAFESGKSQVQWPDSKHNDIPSIAIDIAPYPIDWEDWNRFRILAGYILGTADAMGIKLRWGGDWSGTWGEVENRFNDLPHFELVEN